MKTTTNNLNATGKQLFETMVKHGNETKKLWDSLRDSLKAEFNSEPFSYSLNHNRILNDEITAKHSLFGFMYTAYMATASMSSDSRKESESFKAYTALRKNLIKILNKEYPIDGYTWSIKTSSKELTMYLSITKQDDKKIDKVKQAIDMLPTLSNTELQRILYAVMAEEEFRKGLETAKQNPLELVVDNEKKKQPTNKQASGSI